MNKKDLKIIMKVLAAQIHLHEAVTSLCKKVEATESMDSLGESIENIKAALNLIDEEASNNE